MNILFLSAKKRWAGVITWNISLARKFQDMGHKIYILSAKNSSLTKNAPGDIKVIPLKFGFNYNPWTMFFLINFIQKNKIDIIITNIKREVVFGGIAGKMCGKPVVRLIGNEKDFNSGIFIERNFIDRDIFPCEYTRKLALNKFKWMSASKTEVIHIGNDIQIYSRTEIINSRKTFGADENDLVIGISGRLVKDKGVHVLIAAFNNLCSEFSNIRLVIAGKGNYEPELRALISKLNLDNKVSFAGFVPDIKLTAASYDISVLASLFESFPITLLEYMASGSAVICTDVGGVSELVKDGVNGFLIKHNDAIELEQKLRVLISDALLRQKFSSNALETIKSGFTEKIMAEKTMKLFNELVLNK